VYAASEGLAVIVFDASAFGGQAGASARIENYLGFPTGISGQALTGRAFVQAQKFGAEMALLEMSFCSLAPIPRPAGCGLAASNSTPRDLSKRVRPARRQMGKSASRCCSNRISPACLRWAMQGRGQ
jgi:thioredoxin reductase (NADPH)